MGALLALGVVLAAAAGWRARSRPVRREAGLNVLLLTVDTLRADAVGAYGSAGGPTPWMDRLAAGGVLFEAAHAHNVVTLPSHANILSGRHPFDHGVRDNAGFRFPAGVETLATLLKARGYRTAAFVSAFPLESRFGLARGFDVYDDAFTEEARPAFLVQERAGAATADLARRWIEAQGGGPWLAWVHVYEPHFPYAPPEPFASRFSDPYAGEVAAADAALGRLLEPVLARGDDSRTIVVLTADHGESRGEHGEATHGVFAYEATLKVPLVLHQPRLFRARVVSEPAGHVDVLPTILDALQAAAPDGLPGRSLLPLIAGEPSPVESPTYFEALSGQLSRGWAPLRGVIRDGHKYVDLPLPELYDLRADPGEKANLAPAQPARTAALRAVVDGYAAGGRGAPPRAESAETRQRLLALGYAAGGAAPKARYTEEDDPKRLVELDTMMHDVAGLYLGGDLEGARRLCREVVRRRPDMAVALVQLAQLEREAGDLQAAIEALRRAMALAPADTTTATLLAASLTQAGRAAEAARLLEPQANTNDPDVEVLTTRGLALARAGRTAEALDALDRARAADPSSAMVLVHAGTVRLMAGQRALARAAFEEAVARNPALARAHSSLAFLAAEEGRPDEALERCRKAVALDPGEWPKVLALGSLLWQKGRRAEARTYLELFASAAPPAYAREIGRVRGWLATPQAGEPRGRAPGG